MIRTLKYVFVCIASVVGIGVLIYFGFVVLIVYSFSSGCGMDDGPFEAILIEPIELTHSAQEFELSNNGKLIFENRSDTLSPVITLIENGKVIWTLDTDTRNTNGYESTRIWEISNISITNKTDPIRFRFTGHWSYGAEAGSMEIDREDGDNSFCLSW